MLTNPTAVLGDDKGWVRGLNCVEMELGEPDASGRRSPVEKPGSDFEIECDVVVMALGTSPNPLLSATTSGLETTRRGCLPRGGRGGRDDASGSLRRRRCRHGCRHGDPGDGCRPQGGPRHRRLRPFESLTIKV